MVYYLECVFLLQNNYSFFRIIFGQMFSVYFRDPVRTCVFFSILNLLSLCMQVMMYTTVYYTYSYFVVHEDNQNARKIKSLIGPV